MACRNEDVLALICGELTSREAELLQKHMERCDVCRGAYDRLREIAKELRDLPARRLGVHEGAAMYDRVVHGPPLLLFKSPGPVGARPEIGESRKARARTIAWGSVAALLVLFGGLAGGMYLARTQGGGWEANTPANGASKHGQVNDRAMFQRPRVAVQRPAGMDKGPSVVVNRVTPSGTHIIWSFESQDNSGEI